ncbi:hypothetical protein, partial [Rhizobium sp.]|uniref:hypothetical protein n=1 Tax=Rhizobium sp. TaxID=391 RepID=UPI00289AA39A
EHKSSQTSLARICQSSARELSSTVRKITRMLEEKGVQPIFEKTCYVIPFYKRGDVRSLGVFKV